MSIRTCALVLGLMFFSATARAGDTFKVDPAHSTAIFRIQHANAGFTYGWFKMPEGKIEVDDADPTKTSFDVKLDIKNLDTANAKRDQHLKSPDFFSAEEFPAMTFKSTAVKAAGDKKLEVTGDLTIHGQTKPITVTIDRTGTSTNPQMGGTRSGFEGTFTIKRSDFGMGNMLQAVGDEVRITIALEGLKS
jgi:polyisoprenoid-binding protein YceI